MGLFSGIKNIFKKVLRGIGKIFKPVVNFFGKMMQKKWFKWLMIGAMVFTAGVALYAGVQGFMAAGQAGQSLMGQFVTGAKEFMTALLHPISTAKDIVSGARTVGNLAAEMQGLQAGQAALMNESIASTTGVSSAPVDAITGPGVTTQGAGAAPQVISEGAYGTGAGQATGAVQSGASAAEMAGGAPGAAMGPPAPGPVPSVAPSPAGPPTTGSQVINSTVSPGTQGPMTSMYQQSGGGMAGRVAGGVVDFAKTTGGGLLFGQMLQGYGAGQAEEEYWARLDRVREQWMNPEEITKLRGVAQRRIPVPSNYMASAVSQPWNIRRHYGYPQTVGGPTG